MGGDPGGGSLVCVRAAGVRYLGVRHERTLEAVSSTPWLYFSTWRFEKYGNLCVPINGFGKLSKLVELDEI